MDYPTPLIKGRLLTRYKRFLADVILDDGQTITAACPNTGTMLGLTAPGNPVLLSRSTNPKRKYPHTWEMVALPDHGLVGINTIHPNKIAAEAIAAGLIPSLTGYEHIKPEVRYGQNSRIDLLLTGPSLPPCYVEVKNAHFFRQAGLAEFPDCRTERGAKHLVEMARMVQQGARAVMLYVIQCEKPSRFTIAGDKDQYYSETYRKARGMGVEALALTCRLNETSIRAFRLIPVVDH
jgi:sugar fermentation stimulation protein A